MKFEIEDGLLLKDGDPIADVEDKVFFFQEEKPTESIESAILKAFPGYEIIVDVEEELIPAKKAAPKKKAAKKKPALIEKPDLRDFQGIKDPAYVRALHDSDFEAFRRTYGLKHDQEQEPIESLVRTEKEDLRYPAKRTTCLTKKSFA